MSIRNKRSISQIDVHEIEENKCLKKSKKVSDILSVKRESKHNCLKVCVLSPLSENQYDVSISIDYLNRDFKFDCTCGHIFGKLKRNKCKHIDFLKSSILNKLTKKDFTEYFGIDNLAQLSLCYSSSKNILAIPISSETSESEYEVYLNISKEKMTCQCSCGMKFGIGLRNKCKHISHIIYSLVDKVSDNEELSQTKMYETLKELGI
jgi:hypothetical protein